MTKEIILKGVKVQYDLQYKSVKNLNLRIKSDGKVYVSASRRVSQGVIEAFIKSNADFVLNALEKCRERTEIPQKQYYSEQEIRGAILEMCRRVYPYFEKRGVKYPEIKFRKMVSKWGSCQSGKGVLTFNTNLMYAPPDCVEYVVLHEFTHFLQANHSKLFYDELSKTCPDWKSKRKRMKEIIIK